LAAASSHNTTTVTARVSFSSAIKFAEYPHISVTTKAIKAFISFCDMHSRLSAASEQSKPKLLDRTERLAVRDTS
jgi:hypothetical protein